MKKLLIMLFAISVMISVSAQAEEIILPDPGYYFGRSYDGYKIEFDEHPRKEYEAYVKLLVEQYGMEITEKDGIENDEYVFMEKPGVQNTEMFVSCFESEYEYGMEIVVEDGIILSALDTYNARNSSDPGIITWDKGRIIADPGDFLGYEIQVIEIQDHTDWDYGGNYFQREYEETDMDDIWQYIDALAGSPYFEVCDTYEAKSAKYKQIFFEYVGSNPELSAICKEGRYNPKRTCDLYIQIHDRDKVRSTFRIVTFPAFIVNSADAVKPNPAPDDDPFSILETCNVCNGDGKCRYCWGRGTDITGGDCAVCDRGKCYACKGKGHK